MRVLFLRHAEAVEAGAASADLQRALTSRGRREARRMGAYLDKLDLSPVVVLTSPAVRAVQTAGHAFGKDVAEIEERLAPGAGVSAIRRIIHEHRSIDTLVLVGHEPDFSAAIGALIGSGAAAIKMSKGACACVKGEPRGRFELRWLVGPAQLPMIGKRK